MVLSLCVHVVILLVAFPTAPPARPAEKTLEVTLVNARTKTAPIKPVVVAQNQLDGGGEAESGVAASPLPRTADESADEVVLAALRKRQDELEREQRRLYEQLESQQTTLAMSERADTPEDADGGDSDDADQERLLLNSKISVLKERVELYNARPRREFAGPTAAASDYAEYVEAWRQKIELLGTEHYPDQARGKVYGSLQLTVNIRKDGTLESIEVNRPSEHAILNLAAQRIVQLAAPFPPFPPDLARRIDILAITRTWNFIDNQLDTETP
jgi:protein TonB